MSRISKEQRSRVASVVEAVHRGTPLHDAVGVPEGAVDALEHQAYRMYRAGRLEDAEVMAEGIVALDVTRPYPRLLLGDVYARREEWAEALSAFEKAHQLGDPSGLAAYRCGDALMHMGKHADAVERLQEAVDATMGEAAAPWIDRAEALLERLAGHNEHTTT